MRIAKFPITLRAAMPALLLGGLCSMAELQAQVQWLDGQPGDPPAGKLLSDNEGYWGAAIETGVQYAYESNPQNPPDVQATAPDKFGRRLLDGVAVGDWNVPVGERETPLTVSFQFKQPVKISELAVATFKSAPDVQVEIFNGETQVAHEQCDVSQTEDDAPGFGRLKLAEPVTASKVTITASSASNGLSLLSEVWIWGDQIAENAGSGVPEAANKADLVWMDVSRNSIERSLFGSLKKGRNVLNDVSVVVPRNGRAIQYIMLTSKAAGPVSSRMHASPIKGLDKNIKPDPDVLRMEVGVLGIVKDRNGARHPNPIFFDSETLQSGLIKGKLQNAGQIGQFPQIVLKPRESLFVAVRVKSNGAPPGRYQATVSLDGATELPVEIEVLDVNLPNPKRWVMSWSRVTPMLPYQPANRVENEVQYKQELGINVWYGLPEPGSLSEKARKRDPDSFYITNLPVELMADGFHGRLNDDGLTAEKRDVIRAHAEQLLARAQALNVPFENWAMELWDEPNAKTMPGFFAVAEIVKDVDPRINIYCDPCSWSETETEKAFQTDSEQLEWLGERYKKLVNVSVPQDGMFDPATHPKSLAFLDDPNFLVRALYQHPFLSRASIWKAFVRGWNGYGAFSYFAPQGNPWDHQDAESGDYQMVYPGLHGPIATVSSEEFAQAWQDWRILTFLKKKYGRIPDSLSQVVQGRDMDDQQMSALRYCVSPTGQ